MIDIKLLEKAAKIFEKIKQLDAEIIEIDKYAMLVANGDVEPSFELSFKMLKTEEKEEEKQGTENLLESYSNSLRMTIYGGFLMSDKKKEPENKLSNTLSENATLQILGVLLHEKNAARTRLINQLRKTGVQLH